MIGCRKLVLPAVKRISVTRIIVPDFPEGSPSHWSYILFTSNL